MQLKPFASSNDDLVLRGEVAQAGDRLRFQFYLEDPNHVVEDSLTPGLWSEAKRADELWRTTCFEAFWGIPGEQRYWELNLSPRQQQWNIYAFTDYRTPQPPTPSYDFKLVQVNCDERLLVCDLRSLKKLSALEMNICAVIKVRDQIAYYSAHHATGKADFHWRGGFTSVPSFYIEPD